MTELTVTDPGLPSYVEAGYVQLGYQVYTANPDYGPPAGNPPTVPPNWTTLPAWLLDPTNLPVQGVTFDPPTSVPGFPTGPTTLPPAGSPTGNSSWAAGPADLTGEELGYGPPAPATTDDGLQFPASPSDLILRNEWHGLPSTLNPANVALYNFELETTIRQAVQAANATVSSSVTVLPGGGSASESVTLPISPVQQIEAAVVQAIINDVLQGSNLWYELVLKPVTNGPFAGSYVVNTLTLALPLGIDLTATSSGGNQP